MKLLTELSDDTAFDELPTIWAIVEAGKTAAKLLAVTSATSVDDTETVARGLARAAREAGRRTGYLYLGRKARMASDKTIGYTELTVPGSTSEREGFDAALAAWRTTYDVLIVEVPVLPACTLGAHAARLADGVVIAVCPTRRVVQADRDLRALLMRLSALVIGVVKIASTASVVRKRQVPKRFLSSIFFPVRQP